LHPATTILVHPCTSLASEGLDRFCV